MMASYQYGMKNALKGNHYQHISCAASTDDFSFYFEEDENDGFDKSNCEIIEIDEKYSIKEVLKKYHVKVNNEELSEEDCKESNLIIDESDRLNISNTSDALSNSSSEEAAQKQRSALNKRLCCPHCSYSTPTYKCWQQHTDDHKNNVRKFICKMCNLVTFTKQSLYHHKVKCKYVGTKLNCPHCPYVGLRHRNLRHHMKHHEGNVELQCPRCPYKTILGKIVLNVHIKTEHPKTKK